MKRKKKYLEISLADIPFNPKQKQKTKEVLQIKSIPDIPYKPQLTFLQRAAEEWFQQSFRLNPPTSRDFDPTHFWEQFKSTFGSVDLNIHGSQLMRKHAKTNTVRINKIGDLSQRLQKASSPSEIREAISELLSLLLHEPGSQADQLLHKVSSIWPVWVTNPPATMNADSMEYLLCGFILGQFLGAAKTAQTNYQNSGSRIRRAKQAVDAVEDKVYQIVNAHPKITASKLQQEICGTSFEGFIVKQAEVESERDRSAKYRKGLKVIFDNGGTDEPVKLPRADQLLADARKLLPKRRSGKS